MAYAFQSDLFIRFGDPPEDGRSIVGEGTRTLGGTSCYACELDSDAQIFRIAGNRTSINSAYASVEVNKILKRPILLLECPEVLPPDPPYDDNAPILPHGRFKEIARLQLVDDVALTFRNIQDR